MDNSLCYLIVLAIAVALIIFALVELLSKKRAGETDADVQQRQLRAFGWLILAQIVMAVGAALCMGWNNGGGLNIFRRGVHASSL